MKNNFFYYRGENPTVDLIVINPYNEILLIRRSKNSSACPSMFAFPGGFIDSKAKEGESWESGLETPVDAAIRELAEETNLILANDCELILVGEYSGNNRDPRDNEISWSKTYAFTYKINDEIYAKQMDTIIGMDDADHAEWISIQELQKMELAFDHKHILLDTLNLWQIKKD